MMDDQMTTPTDRNEAIRARAHEIWESEGCPEGREADHWAQAEAEIFGPATAGTASDDSTASEMLGEAELGTAPGAEDSAPAPKARKPRRKPAAG